MLLQCILDLSGEVVLDSSTHQFLKIGAMLLANDPNESFSMAIQQKKYDQ